MYQPMILRFLSHEEFRELTACLQEPVSFDYLATGSVFLTHHKSSRHKKTRLRGLFHKLQQIGD